MRRPGSRLLAVLAAVACAAAAHPATAAAKSRPPSASDMVRAWIRDWGRGEETRVCSRVARPLLEQMALASGTSACSGAVASALNERPETEAWKGVSIVRQQTRLIDETLAEVRLSLRHKLLIGGERSTSVLPERIYLTRPDGRTGSPWRVANLGVLPFVVSGASQIAFDPVTLDPPGDRSALHDPVAIGRPRTACRGESVTVGDRADDVRRQKPPPRAAGQLIPHHPRGDRFGQILAQRPFGFTGSRVSERSLDLRALTMRREASGRVCLEVRFTSAPRPDSRLLVRWFEPVPGADTEGASGSVEVRFDGRGGMHYWFDRSTTSITDPDLARRYRDRIPVVRRAGNVLTIRLSRQDLRSPERFRIALRSVSSTPADPGEVPRLAAGDVMGEATSGFEWPSGEVAPLFDPGTGPVN